MFENLSPHKVILDSVRGSVRREEAFANLVERGVKEMAKLGYAAVAVPIPERLPNDWFCEARKRLKDKGFSVWGDSMIKPHGYACEYVNYFVVCWGERGFLGFPKEKIARLWFEHVDLDLDRPLKLDFRED